MSARDCFIHHIRCALFIPELSYQIPELCIALFHVFLYYVAGWVLWYLSVMGLLLPSSLHILLIFLFALSCGKLTLIDMDKPKYRKLTRKYQHDNFKHAVNSLSEIFGGCSLFSIVMGLFHFEAFFFYDRPGFFQFYLHESAAGAFSSSFSAIVVLVGFCMWAFRDDWKTNAFWVACCLLFFLWAALYTPSFKSNSVPTFVAMIPIFLYEVRLSFFPYA